MAHAPTRPVAVDLSSEPAVAPLVVDVDGSLIRTDLLLEGLISIIARAPARLPGTLAAMLRGRAALKSHVASQDGIDIEALPLEPAVVNLIRERQAAGQPVMLVSGADHTLVSRLAARVGIDTAHGTREVNLTGPAKLEHLRQLCGSFDYVGNAVADVPLWSAANRAFAVNANPLTLWWARRKRPDLVRLSTPHRSWRTWLRALRPHQWAKNLLILLPAVAAHVEWTSARIVSAIAGLMAFSLAASAIYVLNDLVDVPHDRRHLTKRSRPFASGALGPGQGILLTLVLAMTSAVMAAFLPKEFAVVLALYALLSATYTLGAKRIMALDVILLASLYTLRVIAGAALGAVPLSRWFLGFSIFLFLALALIKRVVELQESTLAPSQLLGGRGYIVADTPMLIALGLGATIASTLVYCLYITSDDVLRLYHRPDILWGNLPILLYWQARTWLLVNRHQMHEDPVVFALRDRVSHISLLVFLFLVFLAAR
jgi:4-hydroxybenzoate polyprenyltransferase/phosphoserine phosphatase